MLRLAIATLLTISALAPVPPAHAQGYEALFQEFDAGSLTYDDKRVLQLALAFEGDYNGLLDGAWGKLSQKALDRYAAREFGTRSEDWHMAMLAFEFADRYSVDGWNMRYISGLGMSLLVPGKTLSVDPPSKNFVNFRHRGSSLSVSYGVLSLASTSGVHTYTFNQSGSLTEPYIVRKAHLAVTSSTKSDGSTLYTRSNLVGGQWSTIMISASRRHNNILSAIAASITVGRAEALEITPGGKLDTVIGKALALGDDPNIDGPAERNVTAADPPRSRQSDREAEEPGQSSGSGFYVSSNGHLITNGQVVEDCFRILVDGAPASLIDKSETFDLAVLKAERARAGAFATFAERPARLNSDVTAVGFPYFGLLGGLNVTRGSVSSVKGFGNDAVQMQITAPVQSGNSGGPLLAADGSVVGVVVQKLDAVKIAAVTGDIPQNVNFAVRGELVKLFLSQNDITPSIVPKGERLAPEDLADMAKEYTVFIECQ